ncbi:MAG: hypothetical protein V4598_12885 [Bdellovibrionota bacterium]
MDRRHFLESSMAAIITSWIATSCRSPLRSYPNGGGAYLFLEKNKGISTIRFLDLSSMKYTDVDVPLINPHSAQRILSSQNEIIAFDFMGTGVKANPTTGQVVKFPATDSVFMGHSSQTNDGTIIWTTEMTRDGKTVVRARSAVDLKPLNGKNHEFPGGHHITKLPGTNLLASSWYDLEKKKPCIRFYDSVTGTSSLAELPKNIMVSHFLPISQTEVICLTNQLRSTGNADGWTKNKYSAPLSQMKSSSWDLDFGSPSPLIYASTSGETKLFWPNEKEQLFRFGFGIDSIPGEKNKFVSSHTLSNTVAIWNGLSVDHFVDVPLPNGVIATPDGKVLILSQGELKIYSLKERRFEKSIRYENTVTTISRYS